MNVKISKLAKGDIKYNCKNCVRFRINADGFGFCRIHGFQNYYMETLDGSIICSEYRQLEEWERNKNDY